MIQATNLTKRYGVKTAVDDVTFEVKPGLVTGFLGPNGAGKSTTMRMIMGLDRPTSGEVKVNGKPYAELHNPLFEVGSLLDAKAVHPGRSARNHLLAQAATHGISARRVAEVIELTGLESVAKKRVGGFSLGMGQRLGIANAMLGNPRTLILDEPVNGLDPEGVLWVRQMVRNLADQGHTVILSSHLMSEMALVADHIIVIGRGKILADAPVKQIIAQASGGSVRVRTPQVAQLTPALEKAGATVTVLPDAALTVAGLSAAEIGEVAFTAGSVLHELTTVESTLEEAYLELTHDTVEYRTEGATK